MIGPQGETKGVQSIMNPVIPLPRNPIAHNLQPKPGDLICIPVLQCVLHGFMEIALLGDTRLGSIRIVLLFGRQSVKPEPIAVFLGDVTAVQIS